MILPSGEALLHWTAQATAAAIAAGIAVALALAVHFLLFAVLDRVTRISQLKTDEVVVQRLREPLRWSLIAVAIWIAMK